MYFCAMKQRRYIKLTAEEHSILSLAYKEGDKHHYRERSYAILLSHEGHSINEIARLLHKQPASVRAWFNRWESEGLKGLEIQKGRGVKPKLRPDDLAVVEVVKKKWRRTP